MSSEIVHISHYSSLNFDRMLFIYALSKYTTAYVSTMSHIQKLVDIWANGLMEAHKTTDEPIVWKIQGR